MKKKIFMLTIGLLMMSVLAGCKEQIILPYIERTTPPEGDIIQAAEPFKLKFFVVNPTVNTFVGKIVYTFDNKCLDATQGNSEEVEVSPNNKKAFVKEFTYKGREYSGTNFYTIKEIPECLQRSLKISASLSDKSGFARDNKDFLLAITR